MEWLSVRLTDWPTDRLTVWLTEWLADGLTDCLWLFEWLTGWLTDCLTGWLTEWLIDYWDWLTDWLGMTDWMPDWLADWLTDWQTGYAHLKFYSCISYIFNLPKQMYGLVSIIKSNVWIHNMKSSLLVLWTFVLVLVFLSIFLLGEYLLLSCVKGFWCKIQMS